MEYLAQAQNVIVVLGIIIGVCIICSFLKPGNENEAE